MLFVADMNALNAKGRVRAKVSANCSSAKSHSVEIIEIALSAALFVSASRISLRIVLTTRLQNLAVLPVALFQCVDTGDNFASPLRVFDMRAML
jgi:hypothetical protein